MEQLLRASESDEQLAEQFKLTDTRDWNLGDVRKSLKKLEDWKQEFSPCLYRPFDFRFCYYGPYLMDRPRESELWHARFPNLCLATGRQGQAVGGEELEFNHCREASSRY